MQLKIDSQMQDLIPNGNGWGGFLTLTELLGKVKTAQLAAEAEFRIATERYKDAEARLQTQEARLQKLRDYESLVKEVIRGSGLLREGKPMRARVAGDTLKEVLIINFAFIEGVYSKDTGLYELSDRAV